MKKKIAVILSLSILISNYSAYYTYAFPSLPNIGDMASEAASSISDAAGKAKEKASDIAGKAGDSVSGAMEKAGEFASEKAEQASRLASAAAASAGEMTSGFVSQAGELTSEWAEWAGNTTDEIKQKLADAGIDLQVKASQLGNMTVDKVAELKITAGNTADSAMKAVSDASDYVVDQAGHVVDLASTGASYISGAAAQAYVILSEKGDTLMQIAQNAVTEIDLSDENSWDDARTVVDAAIEKAYEEGVLGQNVDIEVVFIVTSVVFGTLMYGYQYSNGQITLGEYAGSMSEIIIREGLPTGVGFVVSVLPLKIPHADSLAKDATVYLIAIAYGDKDGEKIEAEELQQKSVTGIDEAELETESNETEVFSADFVKKESGSSSELESEVETETETEVNKKRILE